MLSQSHHILSFSSISFWDIPRIYSGSTSSFSLKSFISEVKSLNSITSQTRSPNVLLKGLLNSFINLIHYLEWQTFSYFTKSKYLVIYPTHYLSWQPLGNNTKSKHNKSWYLCSKILTYQQFRTSLPKGLRVLYHVLTSEWSVTE